MCVYKWSGGSLKFVQNRRLLAKFKIQKFIKIDVGPPCDNCSTIALHALEKYNKNNNKKNVQNSKPM